MAKKIRILMRKHEGQFYFQPSGKWLPNREKAKEFESSAAACWWAQDHQLLNAGVDVVFAFEKPTYDFISIRL
jgi:hypothetical protein